MKFQFSFLSLHKISHTFIQITSYSIILCKNIKRTQFTALKD